MKKKKIYVVYTNDIIRSVTQCIGAYSNAVKAHAAMTEKDFDLCNEGEPDFIGYSMFYKHMKLATEYRSFKNTGIWLVCEQVFLND